MPVQLSNNKLSVEFLTTNWYLPHEHKHERNFAADLVLTSQETFQLHREMTDNLTVTVL